MKYLLNKDPEAYKSQFLKYCICVLPKVFWSWPVFLYLLFHTHLPIGSTFLLSDLRRLIPPWVILNILRRNLNWRSLCVVNLCSVNFGCWIPASLYCVAVSRPLPIVLDTHPAVHGCPLLAVLSSGLSRHHAAWTHSSYLSSCFIDS